MRVQVPNGEVAMGKWLHSLSLGQVHVMIACEVQATLQTLLHPLLIQQLLRLGPTHYFLVHHFVCGNQLHICIVSAKVSSSHLNGLLVSHV